MKSKQGSSVAAFAGLEPLESRAYFAAGGPDPSFGVGGEVTTDFLGAANGEAAAAVALPGGKVLAVGRAFNGSEPQAMAITRFLADGSIDATFGQRGQVVLDYGGSAFATDVARQPDGRLVVAGFIDGHPFVARFSADGAPDLAFGQGGKVVLSGPTKYAARVALAPDGKIVLATAETPDPALAAARVAVIRLNADGSFDKTFGGTGTVTTDFGPGDSLGGVAVRPDGRVLVGGAFRQTDYQTTGIALTQFTKDGQLDTTFAGTGSVRGHLFAGHDELVDIALDSKGRVLLLNGGGYYAALGRFRADGVLDRSFATRGVRSLLAGHDDLSQIDPGRLAIVANDSVVVVGTAEHKQPPDAGRPDPRGMAFLRVTETGAADPTFSGDGFAEVMLEGYLPFAKAVAVAADGKITGFGQSDKDLTAIRVNSDGALDNTFGGGDAIAAVTLISSTVEAARATLALPDGKLLVAGSSTGRDGQYVALARYLADGALDTTFGTGGRVRLRLGADDYDITGLALAAGGKILATAAGGYTAGGAVVRFNPDGSLDTSFGTTGDVRFTAPAVAIRGLAGGKFVTVTLAADSTTQVRRHSADGSLDTTFATTGVLTLPAIEWTGDNLLAVQADDKLLVAGMGIHDPDALVSSRYAVYRINTDGSLDSTFGRGGLVETAAGDLRSVKPRTLALQRDGRILLAGMLQYSAGSDFAIARLNTDGTPDVMFGVAGVVITPFPPSYAPDWQIPTDYATTMVVQSDDRIVVAGYADMLRNYPAAPYPSDVDFGLVRYLPDGSLDNTFGDGGKLATDFGAHMDDIPYASLLTPDGRLIVVGIGQSPAGGSDFALAKYFLTDPNPLTARVEGGVLKITGTAAADTIRLRLVGGRLSISGVSETFAAGTFSRIEITGGAGNDLIDTSVATVAVVIDGDAGDDSVLGGSGDDSLLGGAGHDTIFGGNGHDTLRGGDGNDYLNGGPGGDQVFGDAGNDQIFAVDSGPDTINGGAGFDRAKGDRDDLLTGFDGVLA